MVRDSRGTFFIDLKNELSLRRDIMPGHKKQVTTAEVWGGFFMTVQVILLGAIVLFGYLLSRIPISLGQPLSYSDLALYFWDLASSRGLSF